MILETFAEILVALRDSSWTKRVQGLRAAAELMRRSEVRDEAAGEVEEAVLAAGSDEKWEVRKAAASTIAELARLDREVALQVLIQLADDPNRWVAQAAARATRRIRARSSSESDWTVSEASRDPTLRYIADRIREIGVRSLTPARMYELATEVGELFYRELAADTAHEIRTLLTPLEGYLVRVGNHLARLEAPERVGRYLQNALERLEYVELLIEGLHAYTSPAEGDFVRVNLRALLLEALKLGAERAAGDVRPDKVRDTVDAPVELIVEALPDRLTRAVANIAANARQAMLDGGTLAVRVTRVGRERVSIVLVDSGHGMNPENADEALKRFRTTRREKGGTGLGLPIAQRIVEHDHDGMLSIESELGVGTTVTIEIPIRRAKDEN